jgi:hypothetical protein
MHAVCACAGRKQWARALELFMQGLTAPTMVCSAITAATYKKYALVSLIHAGATASGLGGFCGFGVRVCVVRLKYAQARVQAMQQQSVQCALASFTQVATQWWDVVTQHAETNGCLCQRTSGCCVLLVSPVMMSQAAWGQLIATSYGQCLGNHTNFAD